MKSSFRVDYPWYWTYWLGDDAILRVQIMSPARFLTLIICLAFAVVLLLLIAVTILAETASPFTLSLVIIPMFAIPLGVPVLYYRYARNKLADETEEELGRRNSTLMIPWASVKHARIRRSSLQFQTETKSYRMVIPSHDSNEMLEFLVSKLGDKFRAE